MSVPTPNVQLLETLIGQIRGEQRPDAPLSRDTRFVEDLGMASLELIALVYLCEQTFSVSLAGLAGLIETLRTVGQSVDAIAGLQNGTLLVAQGRA